MIIKQFIINNCQHNSNNHKKVVIVNIIFIISKNIKNIILNMISLDRIYNSSTINIIKYKSLSENYVILIRL